MSEHWILNGREPVKATLMEWADMFEDISKRRVDLTYGDGWSVSTVFLGLEHGNRNGDPILFETLASHQDRDEWQTRACSWREAEEQHAAAVAWANGPDPETAVLDRS